MKKQETETTQQAQEAAERTAVETQPMLPGMEAAFDTPKGVTLTELEAENAELKARVRVSEARAVFTGELSKAGARSPSLLFEAVKGEIEFDDEGKAKNADAIIQKLKDRHPEQFGTRVPQSIDGGAGQTSPPRLTRSALARMKPSEIAELDWAEVRRVLAS